MTDFSKFAQILYRESGGDKFKFVLELFKNSTNSSCDYIKNFPTDDNSKDRMRKYLRGKNDITNVACEIINCFNDGGLCKYLEYYEEEVLYEVCQAFNKETDDIDEDELPYIVTDIFYGILEEAAKGKSAKEKVRAVPKTCTVSEADKNDIREIAKNLCSIIYKYKNDSLEYHIKSSSLYTITEEEKSQFNYKIDNNFENFKSLNFRLEIYNKIYPDFEVLSDIVKHYYGIVKSDFEYKYSQELNTLIISPNIEEYNDLLLKIITELSNS